MLKSREVNSLRDAAVLLEETNLELALELMEIAQRHRPEGPFINARVERYKRKINEQEAKSRKSIHAMLKAGDLAIIPAGFRCFTKMKLKDLLGISQPSLPFDSGFFPPESIGNLLISRSVELSYPDPLMATHQVCIKRENFNLRGRTGISFTPTTYDNLNRLAKCRSQSDINSLLDATFGYYTLDKRNSFVLAHYNWHSFADDGSGRRSYDPRENIKFINKTLNARLNRMFDLCERAKVIFFVWGETQGYEFMSLGEAFHDITNLNPISTPATEIFGDRVKTVRLEEINTATKLLSLLSE